MEGCRTLRLPQGARSNGGRRAEAESAARETSLAGIARANELPGMAFASFPRLQRLAGGWSGGWSGGGPHANPSVTQENLFLKR